MRAASCPQCKSEIPYLPEQEGQWGHCLGCGGRVELKQPAHRIAAGIAMFVLGAVGLAALGFFGCLGGLAAVAGHGVMLVVVVIVAMMAGMNLRTVLMIFCTYLAAMVLFHMMFPDNPRGRRRAAVGSPSQPRAPTGQCNSTPWFFNTL